MKKTKKEPRANARAQDRMIAKPVIKGLKVEEVNQQDSDQGGLCSEEDSYSQEDVLRSDLSIDHHPLRRNEYSLVLEANSVNIFDEEDNDVSDEEDTAWIVNEVNVIQECRDYEEDCFAKTYPEQLDDVGMLALNSVYLFAEAPSSFITRHFSNMNCHLEVLRGYHFFLQCRSEPLLGECMFVRQMA